MAALGAVVATATGMVSLRNTIWPPQDDNAAGSASLYQEHVGETCDALNQAQESRQFSGRRLRMRLLRSRSALEKRNAVLDNANEIVAISEHELSRLMALNAPPALRQTHHDTQIAWERIISRLRDYTQRLEAASSADDVLDVVDTLSAMRRAQAPDYVIRAAALTKLGGGRCRPKRFEVLPATTLPRRSQPLDPGSAGTWIPPWWRSVYAFGGFFSPIDNDGVLNVMKAGLAVTLNFRLGGDRGLNIGSSSDERIQCSQTAPTDRVEKTEVPPDRGSSSVLSYDSAADQYNLYWTTKKSWANTCRRLTLALTLNDETSFKRDRHTALFKFTP